MGAPRISPVTTSGASAPRTTVLWKPSGGGDATTWADVMAFVSAANPPVDIYIDEDGTIPAGVNDMKGATLRGPLSTRVQKTVTCENGAVLHNLAEIHNAVTLRSLSSAPVLTFTFSASAPQPFQITNHAQLKNASATSSMLAVPDGKLLLFELGDSVSIIREPGAVNPIQLGTFSYLLLLFEGMTDGSFVNVCQGDPTSVFAYAHFGMAGPYQTPAGYGGTVYNVAMSVTGGSGPSSQRPTDALEPIPLGCIYYDTDLGEEIVWNGSSWGHQIPDATTLSSGLESAADKIKLNSLITNAVPATRQVTAGTGLTGGGDLSVDRSFACSFGSTAGTVCQGNDGRLIDARTPLAHASSHYGVGGLDLIPVATDIANGLESAADKAKLDGLPASAVPTTRSLTAGTGLTGGGDLSVDRTISADVGSGAGQVCAGDDGRLSDARTPLAHASSHEVFGGDAFVDARSTGLIGGGELTINAGDSTKFDIAEGWGVVVSYADPVHPTIVPVHWPAIVGTLDAFLTTEDETYVCIDSIGGVVQLAADPTATQRRDLILIGWTDHINHATIDYVFSEPYFTADTQNQSNDFAKDFGSFNVSGNVYSAATGLALQVSAGLTFELGSNFTNNIKDPNRFSTPAENPVTDIYYYMRDPAQSSGWNDALPSVPTIDPNHWDDGTGTLAPVPDTKFTIQFITRYAPEFLTDVQYGQVVYNDMASALSAAVQPIAQDPYNSFDTVRGWLIVQKGCTDLTDPTKAAFITASKFGSVAGSGGIVSPGEIITASNVGTTGLGLFLTKAGTDLQFKNIAAGDNSILVAPNGTNRTVDISVQQGNLTLAEGQITGLTDDLAGKLASAISVTYAQLSALVAVSSLVPNQWYLITDYQTVYTIPNSSSTFTGPTESLLVQAVTASALSPDAYSPSYPQDRITYELVDTAGWGGTFGRISRRIDTKIATDRALDWRNVVFRRWNDGSGHYVLITDPGGDDHQDFACYGGSCHNSTIAPVIYDDGGGSTIMDNIVFRGDAHVTTFGPNCHDNTFMQSCTDVIAHGDMGNNTFWGNIDNCSKICHNFNNNSLDGNVSYCEFGHDFGSNEVTGDIDHCTYLQGIQGQTLPGDGYRTYGDGWNWDANDTQFQFANQYQIRVRNQASPGQECEVAGQDGTPGYGGGGFKVHPGFSNGPVGAGDPWNGSAADGPWVNIHSHDGGDTDGVTGPQHGGWVGGNTGNGGGGDGTFHSGDGGSFYWRTGLPGNDGGAGLGVCGDYILDLAAHPVDANLSGQLVLGPGSLGLTWNDGVTARENRAARRYNSGTSTWQYRVAGGAWQNEVTTSGITSLPIGPATYVIWVDANAGAGGTGTFDAPFNNLQTAINSIPQPTNATEARRVYTLFITGYFDYDITINSGTLGGTGSLRIQLLWLSPGGIGQFAAGTSNWAVTGTARNVYWNTKSTAYDSIRHQLQIGSLVNLGTSATTHPAYGTAPRISGNIVMASSVSSTAELMLRCYVYGYVDTTSHAAAQLYFNETTIAGDGTNGSIKGGNARIEFAHQTKWKNLVNVATFGQITFCSVEAGGITLSSGASTDQVPAGFFGCNIVGTFTGPAGSAYFDNATFRLATNSGLIYAGGATVTLLDSGTFAGLAGGQTVNGGTAASDNLTLVSTTNATKGKIYLGALSMYDDQFGKLALNTLTSTAQFDIIITTGSTPGIHLKASAATQLVDYIDVLTSTSGNVWSLGKSGFVTSNPVGTASSTIDVGHTIGSTYNQTGTAGSTDLLINRTETAVGSGVHKFLDCQVASVSRFSVDHLGVPATGASNILFGTGSGATITSGVFNVLIGGGNAITNGSVNTIVGWQAGPKLTTTVCNVLLGYMTGFNAVGNNNVLLGFEAGYNIVGDNNVCIGFTAGYYESGSNKLYISNSATTTPLIKGDFSASTLTINGTHSGVWANAASSGTITGLALTGTYNQTGTAGSTDLLIARTETAVGSGNQRFFDCQVGSESRIYGTNSGNLAVRSLIGVVTVGNGNGIIYIDPTYTGNLQIVPGGGSWQPGTGITDFVLVNTGSTYLSATAVSSALHHTGTLTKGTTGTTTGAWYGEWQQHTFGAGAGYVYNGSAPISQLRLEPTINVDTASTTGYTALLVNVTETSVSSTGSKLLLDLQRGGVSKFSVDRLGVPTTGTSNFLFGTGSGASLTDGRQNVLLGVAGNAITGGSFNTAVGYTSGWKVTGSGNTLIGCGAGYSLAGSNYNTMLGYAAGYNNNAGTGNVFIGYQAGFNETGSNLLYVANNITATPLIKGDFSAGTLTFNAVVTHVTTGSASSGTDYCLKLTPTYNQTSTAGSTDVLVNRTETAVGSGAQKFCSLQVGSVERVAISDTGVIRLTALTSGQASPALTGNTVDLQAWTVGGTAAFLRVQAGTYTSYIAKFNDGGNDAFGIGTSGNPSYTRDAFQAGQGAGTAMAASAILQADSTSKGFLPPRMTNAQRLAISSPAVGLMVYCTDATEGLYVNKSGGWTFIA